MWDPLRPISYILELPTISKGSWPYSLNFKEHSAFSLVEEFLPKCLTENKDEKIKQKPLRAFISGESVTGKSRVVQAFLGLSKAWKRPNTVKTIAPTGIAAVQIGGETCHSLFRLGKNGNLNFKICDDERIFFKRHVNIMQWNKYDQKTKIWPSNATSSKICDSEPGENCENYNSDIWRFSTHSGMRFLYFWTCFVNYK